MRTRLLAALFCILTGSFARADDWPQFRGPDRTGVSKEKGLLKAWPKGGPKLLWKYDKAGIGFSSMANSKGVVYTLGTDLTFNAQGKADVKDEYVIAIDEKKGTELERWKIGPVFTFKGNAWGDGPRCTPTIDGDLLFALGGDGQLVCIDLAKKKEAWRKHLIKDLAGEIMDKYGFSEAPLVDGKHLIVTPGGSKGTLAALDKTNGNVIWRSKDLTLKAPFGSAVVAEIHGVRQYIQTCYDDQAGKESCNLAGIDAKTGKLLWWTNFFPGTSDGVSATPIVWGDQIYVSSGFNAGSHLFEINKIQKVTPKYAKKYTKKLKNTHGGVVLIDGYIYGHSEPGMWVCQDFKTGATNDPGWTENVALKGASGAICAADGKLYLYSDDGRVGLVEATPKAFNLISSFEIPVKSKVPNAAVRPTSRSSQIWAHPAIANGVLYLRDHEYVFAFEIK